MKTQIHFLLNALHEQHFNLKHFTLFSLLVFSGHLRGQEEFSFHLAFSDDLGHQDTLILGYDPLATDSIDNSFGETNIINQPWGSNLDVRSLSYYHPSNLEPPTFHSKKQIIDKTCDFDFKILIGMKVANYPLRITWDTGQFQTDSCRMASILSCCAQLETDFYLGPSIFLSDLYPSLLHSGDTLVIDAEASEMLSTYNINDEDIILMWLSFANPNNFNTTSIEQADAHRVQLFPNPTNSLLNVSCSQHFIGGDIQISDIFGKVLWEDQINAKHTTLTTFSFLSTGIYLVKLSNGNISNTQKVIKN